MGLFGRVRGYDPKLTGRTTFAWGRGFGRGSAFVSKPCWGRPRAQAISSLGKWSVSMASCLEENSLTFQPRSRHSNVQSHQVRISIWMVQSLCLHCEGCFQVIFQDPALMHCKSKHSFRKIPKPPLKSPGLQIYLHKYTKALATPWHPVRSS